MDAIHLPPLQEDFTDARRRWRLVITAVDGWRTPRSAAELFELQGARQTLRWSRALPHEYRPRFAAVGSRGAVLLVDEWINVTSRLALQLLDPTGRPLAQYGFDQLQSRLGVSAHAVASAARWGTWVQALPQADAAGDRVRIGAAGRTLVVDLGDGSLSVE